MFWIIRYAGFLVAAQTSNTLLFNTSELFWLLPALVSVGMMLHAVVKYTEEEELPISQEKINHGKSL